MKITRRQFIKGAAATGVALGLPLKFGVRSAQAYAVSPALQKFIDPLPDLVAAAATPVTPAPYIGVDYYEIALGQYTQKLHSQLPNNTPLYGYRDNVHGSAYSHLGGLIVAKKGTPVRIKFLHDTGAAQLPSTHILPVDITIPGAETGQLQNRAAVHLHGGLVPWTSDGGPFHWFAPNGTLGASVPQGGWLPNTTGNLTNDYYYPNNQSARLMWYHDHAIGLTRINAYSGLATGYLITDSVAEGALNLPSLPLLPLVFQDKVFWDPLVDPNYALYAGGAAAGKGALWYPYLYEKQIWKLQGGNNAKKGGMLPIPSAVAEMFGDTMLANGHVYPYQTVSAQTYRFLLLNACQARFLNLSFVQENPLVPGEPVLGKNGLPVAAPVNVTLIGTEGGFLKTPVPLFLGGVAQFLSPLLLGPAERADLIVDFSQCPNTNVILYNDAPAPYPAGNPMFDWFLGVKGVTAGFGPNTRTITQFRIGSIPISPATWTPPPAYPDTNPVLPVINDTVNGGLKLNLTPGPFTFNGVSYNYLGATQELTLNEAFDIYGRLMQLVGTNVMQPAGGFGQPYLNRPTEFVGYNTIQIWNIYNLTADAHPMHFHLFNVMVLRRRPFRVNQFNGIPIFTALGVGPDPNEIGWKETVKMYPGTCTTVAVLVEPPLAGNLGTPIRTVTVTPNAGGGPYTGTLPYSPRLNSSYQLQGDEYVWHCHILEHEEHDMMRPLVAS
jgi:spore coat protein A, manganese oxidase